MILNEVNIQGRCCCPISQTCLHNPNRLSPQHSGHLKLPRNRALETLLQKTQVPGSLQECATRADLDHVVDGRRVGSVVVGGAVVVIEADGVDAAGNTPRGYLLMSKFNDISSVPLTSIQQGISLIYIILNPPSDPGPGHGDHVTARRAEGAMRRAGTGAVTGVNHRMEILQP